MTHTPPLCNTTSLCNPICILPLRSAGARLRAHELRPSSRRPADGARGASPAGRAAPDDANDLRGYHFRELLHKPLTWILVGGGSLAARGRSWRSPSAPVVGAIAFVVAFLIGLWLTFNVADSRAADDFFARLRAAARPDPRRQDRAAAGDAAAAQGRRPATPSGR